MTKRKRNRSALSGQRPWQRHLYEIIFEAETRAGKAFDVILLFFIAASIVIVMLESVESYQARWGTLLLRLEWVITILFTGEYLARILCVPRRSRYIFSFFGLVDLLSILPSYISLVGLNSQALATIRTLRLMRVFRVFKMGRHLTEAETLLRALQETRAKITVFAATVVCAIIVLSTIMYLVEQDADSGFDNIPVSIYWGVVTLTTVGYGDIAPKTELGQAIAAITMLLGYSIIIVPTGIFSAEVMGMGRQVSTEVCPVCLREGHDLDANYCKFCGGAL